jgi:hypothetical protein
MGGHGRDSLELLDGLIGHLRPIEHLFMVMGEVGHDTDGAQLAHACAEIGLALTARFRDHMERPYPSGGEPVVTAARPGED